MVSAAALSLKPSSLKALIVSSALITRWMEALNSDRSDMENTIPENGDEITLAAFERWLKVARPGESFVYHIGHLASDREQVQVIPQFGQPVRIMFEPYNSLGLTAWNAYEHGNVELVQRKLPGNVGYEYIAFKRRAQRRHHV